MPSSIAYDGLQIIADNEHVSALRVTVVPGATVDVPPIYGSVFVIVKAGTLQATWADSGKSETWVSKEGEGGWVDAEPGYSVQNRSSSPVEFCLIQVKSAKSE